MLVGCAHEASHLLSVYALAGMIKLLLVDDHDLVRTAIRRLLESSGRVAEVLEASSAESALALVRSESPDVVLMDLAMPGLGGFEATRRIHQQFPHTKVIILSAHSDGPFPRRLLSEGAQGYLTKGSNEDEVLTAIDRVLRGQKYIAAEIAQKIAMESLSGQGESPFDSLSSRELQIVIHTARGKRNNEIAEALFISPKTVSTYRGRAMEKLGVSSTGSLVRLAMQHGLLDDDPQ